MLWKLVPLGIFHAALDAEMIKQVKTELLVYLTNCAKTRKNEQLPKNCVATAVASCIKNVSAIEYIISKSNKISAKHCLIMCCTTVITAVE